MQQSKNFQRAKNMIMQHKFVGEQQFTKELTAFLNNYFEFDGLTVEVLEGKNAKLVLVVSVCQVKNIHIA